MKRAQKDIMSCNPKIPWRPRDDRYTIRKTRAFSSGNIAIECGYFGEQPGEEQASQAEGNESPHPHSFDRKAYQSKVIYSYER